MEYGQLRARPEHGQNLNAPLEATSDPYFILVTCCLVLHNIEIDTT